MPQHEAILIIEDNDDHYHMLQQSFQKAQFPQRLLHCLSGDDALDYLYQREPYDNPAKYPLPALILLDLNLPGTDGREVLRLIKAEESLKQIPVIVLTTSSNPHDVAECYRLGANTYIQKPLIFKEFVKTLQQLNEYWFKIATLPPP